MKWILSYYVLNILFTILTALISVIIAIYLFDLNDPKFGKAGLLLLAVYISAASSAVSSLGSTILFRLRFLIKNSKWQKRYVLFATIINGIIVGMLYYPLIIYAPMVNHFSDWPQYITYFLFLGFLAATISDFIFSSFVRAFSYLNAS